MFKYNTKEEKIKSNVRNTLSNITTIFFILLKVQRWMKKKQVTGPYV